MRKSYDGMRIDMDDDCRRWAFGEKHRSIPFYEEDDHWNKRHSDIFVVLGSDSVLETYEKIKKAYDEFKKSEENKKNGKIYFG